MDGYPADFDWAKYTEQLDAWRAYNAPLGKPRRARRGEPPRGDRYLKYTPKDFDDLLEAYGFELPRPRPTPPEPPVRNITARISQAIGFTASQLRVVAQARDHTVLAFGALDAAVAGVPPPPKHADFNALRLNMDRDKVYAVYSRRLVPFEEGPGQVRINRHARMYLEFAEDQLETGDELAGYFAGLGAVGIEADNHWLRVGGNRYGAAEQGKRFRDGGRLMGLYDTLMRAKAPYTVGWLIGIVPLSDAGAQWLSMRDGETNCLTAAFREACGSKITDKQKLIIDHAEALILASGAGATLEDAGKLAKALRAHVTVKDVAGHVLYENAGFTNQNRQIELYRSDGHVTLGRPNNLTRKVVVVDGDIAIPEIRSAWCTSAVYSQEAGRQPELLAFQEVFDSETGTLYRHKGLQDKLEALAAQAGVPAPQHAVGGGEKAYARKLWHLRHGFAKIPSKSSARADWRSACIEAVTYASTKLGVRDGKLREGGKRSGITLDLSKAYLLSDERDSKACGPGHEHAKRFGWPTGGKPVYSPIVSLDGIEDYAGAVHFTELTLTDGAPNLARHQLHCMATKAGAIAREQAEQAEQGQAEQPAQAEEKNTLWLPVPVVVFLRERGWIASAAVDMLMWHPGRVKGVQFPESRNDAVALVGASAPNASARRTFRTRDKAEADHFAAIHGSAVIRQRCGVAEGDAQFAEAVKDGGDERFAAHVLYCVDLPVESASDRSYFRAYVLGYLAITMWSAAAALGANMLAANTDAILVPRRAALPAELPQDIAEGRWLGKPEDQPYKWGAFRAKPEGIRTAINCFGEGPTSFAADAYLASQNSYPVPLPTDAIARERLTALIGPGGTGKTYRALRAFPGRRVAVLGPTHRRVAALKSKDANPNEHAAHTYHGFLHMNFVTRDASGAVAKRGGKVVAGDTTAMEFDPATFQHPGVDVVVWDEYAVSSPKLVETVVECLLRFGVQVVLAGDPTGQLCEYGKPSSGEEHLAMLRRFGAEPILILGPDRRAAGCPRLMAAKIESYCQSTAEQKAQLAAETHAQTNDRQLRILVEVAGGQITEAQALEEWIPGDLAAEPHRGAAEVLRGELERIHIRKFANVDMPLVFIGKGTRFTAKGGVLPLVDAPNGEKVPASLGRTITCSTALALRRDRSLWAYDGVSTAHSLQGETLEAPRKLFVRSVNLAGENIAKWAHNASGVLMSRVQRASQLRVFA